MGPEQEVLALECNSVKLGSLPLVFSFMYPWSLGIIPKLNVETKEVRSVCNMIKSVF